MTDITITRLTDATQPAVDELNVLMAQLTTDPEPLTSERLAMILQAGTVMLVAQVEGRIVATTSLVVMRQPRGDKAWIEDVVVDETHRGQGIARRLLEKAVEAGWAAGCRSVNMSSKPGREMAQKLYANMGFKERDTRVFRLERPKN